jgi:hypothetical protein
MLKKIFFLFLILITFNACKSIKEGLTGKKQMNTDEFLIEKKNPLVLPPEFTKLPEPKIKDKNNKKEVDLKSILTQKKVSTNAEITDVNSTKSLEKSLLEKIKNN